MAIIFFSMSKRNVFTLMAIAAVAGFISSCATIAGGGSYVARVQVANHPDATIVYRGMDRGTGVAIFNAKRRDADKFSVTIKKEGCETQTKDFVQRSFRGWAFTGSLLGWTGLVPGTFIPLPWGLVVDGATGAWWKPDENEPGVTKMDYDHFFYEINYTGCKEDKGGIEIVKSRGEIEQVKVQEVEKETEKEREKNREEEAKSRADQLIELKKQLDKGEITQVEYEVERNRILSDHY